MPVSCSFLPNAVERIIAQFPARGQKAAKNGPRRGRFGLSKNGIDEIRCARCSHRCAAQADKAADGRRAIHESPLRAPSAVWGMAVRAAFQAVLE